MESSGFFPWKLTCVQRRIYIYITRRSQVASNTVRFQCDSLLGEDCPLKHVCSDVFLDHHPELDHFSLIVRVHETAQWTSQLDAYLISDVAPVSSAASLCLSIYVL